MKKHLLTMVLVSLMLVPTIGAQTFEFRYHGESLADGATVTIVAEVNEFDELACVTNPFNDPNNGLILKLLSGSQAQGNASINIEENSLNPARVLWCMGGSCVNLGSNTSYNKEFSTNNGIVQVQFDAEDIQSEGHLLATLTATIGSETHTVKIKFTNGEQQVVPGDVDGDGVVTAGDITALYNFLLNSDDTALVNGDQDGDNTITAGDITLIYNILLGN